VLLARYLGNSSEAAKLYFAALWGLLRPVLVGCPAQTPRIWST
jgi:urease accessory protein